MSWVIESAKLEAKKIFSYRVDFWAQFAVAAVVEVAIAYFLWKSIYDESATPIIGGYTFKQMLLYYIFVPLVGRIVRSQEDMGTAREIYDGSLTKFLIFPLSFLKYKYMQKIVYSGLSILQMLLALFVVQMLFSIDIPWSFQNFILGFASSLVSMLLFVSVGLCLELVAFWADTVWSLAVLLRFIAMFFGGALLPLSLFPEWSQRFLEMSPFPYMFSVPIRTFLGELSLKQSLNGILITTLWILPVLAIQYVVYRVGLKNYTGVGI